MPASESLKPLLDLRDDAYLLGLRMLRNAADAEDAVQDAYLRVARSNAQLPPEAERRTWFLCIVANAARDLLRSNQRRRTRDTEAAMNATRTGETITSEKRAEIRELREQVVRAVDELEEKFRLPVSLHYEQGLTHAQSAQILQMDHGTVRVYASRRRSSRSLTR
ncbi:MAG TPA: RNA polymerase sigma factor [Planctomycetota bacterium]|nr:RNA polymerase sigma factor [Planctomycetota bacterium]